MKKSNTKQRKWAWRHEVRQVFPTKKVSHKRTSAFQSVAGGLHEAQAMQDGLALPRLEDMRW